MNRLLATASMIAVTVFVSQANAAEERWPRWYVGLSGGVGFLDDTDISGAATGELDFDTGAVFTGSLGYMPPTTMQPFSNMRIEAELGYRYHSMEEGVLAGTGFEGDDQLQIYSYMANAYYDFRNASRWTPYIGAGAGGARVEVSNENDHVFAWQLMTGIAYAPRSMPMTEWSLGYRYFVANSPEFESAGDSLSLDDVTMHNVEFGGRFRF